MEIMVSLFIGFIAGFVTASKIKEKEVGGMVRRLAGEYFEYVASTTDEDSLSNKWGEMKEEYPIGADYLKDLKWRYCSACAKKQWSYSKNCKVCNSVMKDQRSTNEGSKAH